MEGGGMISIERATGSGKKLLSSNLIGLIYVFNGLQEGCNRGV
jgi:hypothetical protein